MSTKPYRPDDLYGRTVYASDGEKLGRVDDVLLESDGSPAYVETSKGLFSGRRHVMPVEGMSLDGDDLTVAYTKDQIEGAPPVNQDDEIDYERERELGAHYGAQVRDWDETADSMTRSEEELRVGTHRAAAGRVRLRKYVETETARETVTLEREEATVTREPLAPGEGDGAQIGERQVELELSEEVADVETRVVPKERVGLEVETVVEEQRVSDEVRREQIEVSGDVDEAADREERGR